MALTTRSRLDTLHFDSSNPKIYLGLLIGGMLPYLITAIPTTITKWLLFIAILRRRPNVLRLFVVTIAEPICLFLAAMIPVWIEIPRFVSVATYPVLAMFPNLFLFPSGNRPGGNSFLKKYLYAFALGLIYPLCALTVGLTLSIWLAKF